MLHYAKVQVMCDTQELYIKGQSCERSCQNQERRVQGTKGYLSVRLADSTQVQMADRRTRQLDGNLCFS